MKTPPKQRILEILSSGDSIDDEIAFGLIMSLKNDSYFALPLLSVYFTTSNHALKPNIHSYLEYTFPDQNVEYLKEIKFPLTKEDFKTEKGFYESKFYQYLLAHFSKTKILDIFYFIHKRTGLGTEKFLLLDESGHPRRNEIFQAFVKDQKLEDEEIEIKLGCLTSQEIQIFSNHLTLKLKNKSYLKLALKIFEDKSIIIPPSLLSMKWESVEIKQDYSNLYLTTFPSYIFKFENVKKLILFVKHESILPENWSTSFGFEEINFEGEKNIQFENLDFLQTIPRLRKVHFNNIQLSSFSLLLKAKHVLFSSYHRKFLPRSTRLFPKTREESIGTISFCIKNSNLSDWQKEKFIRNFFESTSLKDLSSISIFDLKILAQSNLGVLNKYVNEALLNRIQLMPYYNEDEKKVLELICTNHPANDLLAFELAKHLDSSNSLLLSLFYLWYFTTNKNLKEDIIIFLKEQYKWKVTISSGRHTRFHNRKPSLRYFRRYVESLIRNRIVVGANIVNIPLNNIDYSELLYIHFKRTGEGLKEYMDCSDGDHPRRAEMFRAFCNHFSPTRFNTTVEMINLFPKEMLEYAQKVFPILSKNKKDFKLLISDLHSEEIPSFILEYKIDTLGVREYFSTYFPSYIFKFKNVKKLMLSIGEDYFFPSDWSQGEGFSELYILGLSRKIVLKDLDFISTIKKLKILEIREANLAHPDVLLSHKKVFIKSNNLNFLSTEGYDIKQKAIGKVFALAFILKNSDFTFEQQKIYFKKFLSSPGVFKNFMKMKEKIAARDLIIFSSEELEQWVKHTHGSAKELGVNAIHWKKMKLFGNGDINLES